MALSASAPIFGFPGLCDEYGWNRVVTEAFRFAGGDECVEDIRSGYWQTGALSPEILSKEFNTCVPATLPCHSIQVAELVMNWLPTAAELGSYPVSNPNRSLTAWACDTVRGSPNGMAAYKRLLAPSVPGQCLNVPFSANSCIDETKQRRHQRRTHRHTSSSGGYCATHWNDTSTDCQDGWGIESCTTEIHPISSNNVTDFFPPSGPFDVTQVLAYCRGTYGTNLRVDALAMPRGFGQLDIARMAASASRIIFSSGQFDPWSAQSVNQTLSDLLQFVYIEGGAHHSDIGNNYNPIPTSDDTVFLIAAREKEIQILHEWVAKFSEERKKFVSRMKV